VLVAHISQLRQAKQAFAVHPRRRHRVDPVARQRTLRARAYCQPLLAAACPQGRQCRGRMHCIGAGAQHDVGGQRGGQGLPGIGVV